MRSDGLFHHRERHGDPSFDIFKLDSLDFLDLLVQAVFEAICQFIVHDKPPVPLVWPYVVSRGEINRPAILLAFNLDKALAPRIEPTASVQNQPIADFASESFIHRYTE